MIHKILMLAILLCSPALATERPNIVFFLADDLGQRDLGCYGSTFYETPHLDRLASEGLKFTDAYAACPVCSPTRASILTGRWPQRTGVTDYIGAAAPEKWNRNTRLRPAPYADRLALDEITLAEALRSGLRDLLCREMAPRPRGKLARRSRLRHQHGRKRAWGTLWRKSLLLSLR